jgi:hypothetical protein
MILTIARYSKLIACCFYALFYFDWLLVPVAALGHSGNLRYYHSTYNGPETKALPFPLNLQPVHTGAAMNGQAPIVNHPGKTFSGGPSQPEMQAFSSVNANNMVDLFSGDFSYNIPLMDVGGYPVNLSYRGGIGMDQDASWVGLAWNINPGTIARNMRGLPDDFDGRYDSVKKTMNVKENKTVGVTAGANAELVGFPLNIGASLGVFKNTYKGWGVENGINASINSGAWANGALTGGLSITNNSQDGLTLQPTLSARFALNNADENSGNMGSFSVALPYNSRAGLKGLQLEAGIRQYNTDDKNQLHCFGSSFSTGISFASPAFTPTITLPLSSRQFSFTAKVGLEEKIYHPSLFVSGYVSKQTIEPKDSSLQLPAYGYLHLQDGTNDPAALTDFNREKEIPYREKPAVPHIAIPAYTYDAFSITGEGTGGMFRAYRGDIGYIHDPFIRTKDASDRLSVDVGLADLAHIGVDLNVTRAFTQSGPWLENNPMGRVINFRKRSLDSESVYFRNPGEKSVNNKQFYETLGGDDVVAVNLYQPGVSSSAIQTTNYLSRYHDKRPIGKILLTPQNTIKTERDKRTQVISYLTAAEADVAGLSKYIESYTSNQFSISACSLPVRDDGSNGTGLPATYYTKDNLTGTSYQRTDPVVNFIWGEDAPSFTGVPGGFPKDFFSIRWEGRIKAPKTGKYIMTTVSDDGMRLWINDSLIRNHWDEHAEYADRDTLNLVAGQFYKIKLEYFEAGGDAIIKLLWVPPGETKVSVIPQAYLFPPEPENIVESGKVREKRINRFRKSNHISEIDVLNNDGRRYVYGIPVYNLKQEEATFNIDSTRENKRAGLVGYNDGLDNTTKNINGKDHYFSREDVPAYAHSFLLTGIVSPDYVDVTGNGVSDDDLGDAVRFNYSKVCGINNPYPWRVPYKDSASLSEGLKTDNRDDKGNYVYGEKELWYLHSISSKTMIATFTTENRLDLNPINRLGQKSATNPAQRLKEINLYSKAEFLQKGVAATPIKTVHFEYSYQLCPGINRPLNDSGKLTLKKVWFTYNNNKKGQLNPYIFHYSNTNPSYNTRANDRWGTYKDPLQNPGSTSTHFLGNDEYPYPLQDSTTAAINATAWTLDSIYLPSGGSMKVDFESDDYAFVQNKRAAQPFKLLGLGNAPGMTTGITNQLYTSSSENLYVYVKVPSPVTSKNQVYQKYLQGLKKLYFRLSVSMPGDIYGGGNESVPCYADLDTLNGYGFTNANTIWLKLKGISLKGDADGSYSPLAKAATQFLRLNLSSKAYPGSEVGENLDLDKAVKLIFSLATNVIDAFKSFDGIARDNSWASQIDTAKTWIRLNSPDYKKYGGGHRVKRVTIYDNWDKMTQQRAALYGQEYCYTTKKDINGIMTSISSGVASYEPGIGADENPFHVPIEYVEKIAPLGPVTLGYTEEPLAESLFPAAGIGYSKVRVRTINYKNTKSANGYSETQFYTAYDFPVYTDRTLLDDDTKKRFKPAIANFLRINAKHHVVLSQGFKIELNDMHGKLRSQASYSETDPDKPTTYTENFYKVEDPKAESKRLSNIAMVIKPDGTIDSAALIGKDAELMVDMREQLSVTNAYNANINSELFTVPSPIPPFFLIPSLLNLAQREETMYRSAAVTKVIQRYGIVDSVLHIDKGSKISTKDIAYDSETGDALVTRTQNEFNDPVYNFNYPSHWAYDGMGLAYKNIGTTINAVDIKNGRIIRGLTVKDTTLFAGGDEIIVAGKQKTGNGATPCIDVPATFPVYNKLWATDSSVLNKGPKAIYFIDADGKPYNGSNVSLKVIRSGRRNMLESVGAVSTLDSVVRRNSGIYQLVLNTASKVINASSAEFYQFWQVEDRKRKFTSITCLPDTTTHCNDTIPAVLQDSSVTICFSPATNAAYNSYQATIYPTSFSTTGVSLTTNPGFWTNVGGTTGRLNDIGIWTCGGCLGTACGPGQTWVGFSKSVYIPVSDTFFIGMGGDNSVRVTIDRGTVIGRYQIAGDDLPFKSWHIYPYFLTRGYHEFKMEGWNQDNYTDASFGAEIYNLRRTQIISANDTTIKSNTIFGTDDVINQSFSKGLSCPIGYDLDTSFGHSYCIKTIPCAQHCDTIISGSCRSIVTDTSFNPYITGVLGNWRANKAYTYYAARTETDPSVVTNLRSNGTFASFNAFWNFQSSRLLPVYDTTRWIWNSEKTLFNRKGMEVENKDPLGRFNAGLYGYNLTMTTAVIQNAHYRESGFDGFEDYGFVTQFCDTGCTAARHIDFSTYKSWLDTSNSHTGLYSLKLGSGQQASLGFKLVSGAEDSLKASIAVSTQTDTCQGTGTMLKEMKISNRILLPVFSPFQGQRMVLSAWVKEARDCKCASYDSNRVVVSMTGSSPQSFTFKPSGNVIEGWQRYESVFDIPANDTALTVSLQSTGQASVFFDDLRLHPFNANMKSFVFNPVNLRLMAELDENNYATYYEYDDDGTLIRVKKETERGVKTIKETRSALLKQ